MPKLYRPVIVRKEVDDEHYYFVDGVFTPAVTKILDFSMPTPFALRYWIGEVGNEKAQAKLEAAGTRGTLLHEACEALMRGDEVDLLNQFPDKKDKKALTGFVNWFNAVKPEYDVKDIEFTVASQQGYAGTLDLHCRINKEDWIIDFKTSANVYDGHKLQVAAYQQAYYEMTGKLCKMGILHLNPKVRAGYSFHSDLEIRGKAVTPEDFFKVFAVYKMLNGGVIPEPDLTEVYPEKIKLFEEVK